MAFKTEEEKGVKAWRGSWGAAGSCLGLPHPSLLHHPLGTWSIQLFQLELLHSICHIPGGRLFYSLIFLTGRGCLLGAHW